MDALGQLLKKKEFDDISIQEISDEANLTRATFYLHYPDKAALLQAMTAARFGEMLMNRRIGPRQCAGVLKAIALGVCDYLAKASGCPSSLRKMPLERSLIPAIEEIVRVGAAELRLPPGVTPDTFAATLAWAIFGAASHWAQTPNRKPAEQMAEEIESLLRPLLQSFTPV
ncbi:MAG: transcriptional regulator [Akkermansiaceae bacterium]|nr:transcriptional regulator [Akkermansiaceae bacterium]